MQLEIQVLFCIYESFQKLNMDVEDKSVEVDFEWVKNLVSEGKIRVHSLTGEPSKKFLLLDVRRLAYCAGIVFFFSYAAVNNFKAKIETLAF